MSKYEESEAVELNNFDDVDGADRGEVGRCRYKDSSSSFVLVGSRDVFTV